MPAPRRAPRRPPSPLRRAPLSQLSVPPPRGWPRTRRGRRPWRCRCTRHRARKLREEWLVLCGGSIARRSLPPLQPPHPLPLRWQQRLGVLVVPSRRPPPLQPPHPLPLRWQQRLGVLVVPSRWPPRPPPRPPQRSPHRALPPHARTPPQPPQRHLCIRSSRVTHGTHVHECDKWGMQSRAGENSFVRKSSRALQKKEKKTHGHSS